MEPALDVEMTEHLGHDKLESAANLGGNTRNPKTLKGEFGELPPSRGIGMAASSHS